MSKGLIMEDIRQRAERLRSEKRAKIEENENLRIPFRIVESDEQQQKRARRDEFFEKLLELSKGS